MDGAIKHSPSELDHDLRSIRGDPLGNPPHEIPYSADVPGGLHGLMPADVEEFRQLILEHFGVETTYEEAWNRLIELVGVMRELIQRPGPPQELRS